MLDKNFPIYILAFVIAFTFTVLIEKALIPTLSRKAKQPIYEEGPKWHAKKSGTPTMGGLAFLIAIAFSMLICALIFTEDKKMAVSLLLSQIYAISNASVGIIDDLKKLKRKHNKGLSAKGKLLLQLILAIAFLFMRHILLSDGEGASFSFGEIDLGYAYYPIAIFILLGIINCANITDGIDGLASSVAFSVGVSTLYISAALNYEVALISSAIIGATVGFLIFNLHPAKIFMGDTGSLYFGALIAATALSLHNPFLIIFLCGVYVFEGCTVILQVISFKLFKKRIFKMAPFHHHLERCGWSENKICIVAIIATFIFSIPAYVFYLP